MEKSLNFTVTEIGHIHLRTSHSQWKLVNLINPDHYIIAYAESGKCHYLLDGKDVVMEKDHLAFFQKGQAHSAHTDPEDPWRYFSLSFDLLFLDEQSREVIENLPAFQAPSNSSRCRNLLFSLYRIWTLQPPGYYLLVRSLLMELLQEILCGSYAALSSDAQRLQMQKALAYIHSNLTQTCSVATLAKIAGFSESYFSKLFRQMTGKSVITYQNLMRLSHARSLLQLNECNVSEAAAAVGFRDIYYFSRMYKKLLGETPTETIQKSIKLPAD